MSEGDGRVPGRVERDAARPVAAVGVEPARRRPGRAGPGLPRALRPFRYREYRLLAMSGSASLLADGLWLVALVWQVIGMGGSPSDLSLVSAATSLGLVVAVLMGGVAADRFPKRAVLVCVEVVRIAVPVLTGVLALAGVLQLWPLAALAFAVGAAGGFYYPTWSAVVPALLPADELLAANGIEGMLRPLAQQAAGPALAGLLVAAFSPQVALLGAGVVYAVALLPLLAMRPVARSQPSGGDGDPSVRRQLAEGFAYLFRTGWLFATLVFATLYVLVVMGPIEVLLPFAIRDRVGAGPAALSLVLAAYGVGSAAGALLVASARLPRRYLTVMLLCWGLGALPLAAFGLSTLLWVMVVASFVVGITDAAAMVIWGTLLQRRVPAHLLGRVSSLDFFVSLALMPVSMALAGPVGEHVGIPLTFVAAAVVPSVLAVVALLAWRLPRDELAHPLDRGTTSAARSATARSAPRSPP
jgi:MFS family permease